MEAVILVVQLVIVIAVIAGLWKAFAKAGAPGWSALVPFLNLYVMIKMSGKPVWWFILFFIPIVNFIVAIILAMAIAERFGKGAGFGIGLALLGFVFWPILGFGSAEWQAEEFSW